MFLVDNILFFDPFNLCLTGELKPWIFKVIIDMCVLIEVMVLLISVMFVFSVIFCVLIIMTLYLLQHSLGMLIPLFRILVPVFYLGFVFWI